MNLTIKILFNNVKCEILIDCCFQGGSAQTTSSGTSTSRGGVRQHTSSLVIYHFAISAIAGFSIKSECFLVDCLQVGIRPRIKRVNFKDMLFVLEQDPTIPETLKYKAHCK